MTSPSIHPALRKTLAIRLLAAMSSLTLASSPVFAASQTWDGAASGIWDTSALNWGGIAFASGNDALFSGTPTNDVTTATGLTIGTITLDNTFTGSVSMTGANTVNGATTISGGTLRLTNLAGLGTSVITVNSGGKLWFNYGAGINLNTISGDGLIELTPGTDTATLSGNLSGFTGTLSVLSGGTTWGKLAFGNVQGNQLSSSATIQVQNGATVYLNNALNYNAKLELFGAGGPEPLGALRIENGNQTGSVTLKGNTTIGTNVGTGTISGAIGESGGSFGFTKVAAGTTVLSGTNTYTGGTTISAGTLQFSKLVAMPNAGAVTANGGTLAVNVGGTGEWTTGTSGNGTIGGLLAGLGGQSGGTVSWSGNSVLGIDTTNAGSTQTYSGIIANVGTSLGLTKQGTGTLELSGANTYTGATTVAAGTLNLTGSVNSGTGGVVVGNTAATKAILSINSGASLTANNLSVGTNATASGAVYQSGGSVIFQQAAAAGNFQLGAVANGYGYYKLSAGTLTSNEVGVGGLFNNSTGVMDVTGGTLTSNGYIVVGRGGGTSSGVLNITGGTVAAKRIHLDWAATSGATAVLNVGGGAGAAAVSTTGSTTLGLDLANANNLGTLGVANLLTNGTLTTGIVTGSSANPTTLLNFNGGTLKATTTNASTNFLTNANVDAVTVYSNGGTIDNNGTNITVGKALAAATGNGLTSIAVTNGGSGYIGAPMVKISGGTGNTATGYAVMVDDGTGNGTYKVGSIVITSPGTYTVDPTTVTLTGGGASTAASGFSISTGANTSGGMTFSGSGTTTLNAANTYTGLTTISAGTLALGASGTIANSSGVNLGTAGSPGTLDLTAKNAFNFGEGQTVSGHGTINIGAGKTVTIEGSFAPGNSPGMVTVTGDLTLAGTSTTTMEIESLSSMDLVTVSGTLTYGGDLVIEGYNGYSLSSVGSVGTYNLFDLSSTTAWAGAFESVTLTGIGGLTLNGSGFSGTHGGLDYTFVYSSGDLTIAASAIPEPSTYAGLAGLVALGVVAYRRRRRA